MTRDFHLGDILSITTGHLVSPRHVEGIYDILNFMTGESLFTHQLPRGMRECSPVLLKQHPQLSGIDASGVNADNWKGWLGAQVKQFGETLPVAPLASREAQYDSPIGDLVEMLDGDTSKIVVVEP